MVMYLSKINSPLITILLGYLLTAEQKYHRSIELARVVYPDTIADKQNPTKNLSTLIHRLNELFGKISDIALIPPNGLGYTLNSELHIITDLDQFESLWIQAQNEVSIIRMVECLKKAFSLYKGNAWVEGYPEDRNDYPLQYSCLKNSMNRRAWWAIQSMGLQRVRHH